MLKTLDGEARFSCLVNLITGPLTIPVSNADPQMSFLILGKVHTDQRTSLSLETISMMTKFNSIQYCYFHRGTLQGVQESYLKTCQK